MAEPKNSMLGDQLKEVVQSCKQGWAVLRHQGPSALQFWFIALLVGIAAGLAACGFRIAIEWLQGVLYDAKDIRSLQELITDLDWYFILTIPVMGGLITGVILHHFTPDARARSVAEVIEGAAMNNGRVEKKAGLASAVASMITLSTGGSTGREGPVVHLAGVISSWVSGLIKADGITGRDLLGCAVAAAVSASFNAPIAGALFALEVVLRHFAVHAFAPIVIASVAGTVISRTVFGDVPEFVLPDGSVLGFYRELPAYLILGLLSGIVAVIMMRTVFWADSVGTWFQNAVGLPRWLRPAVAGLLLGAIAIAFPHIIGVGYGTTFAALTGEFLFYEAVIFAIVKVIAVSITMAGRMGGGIFSPALMVGALTGLAFGTIATSIFPEVSGTLTIYALAGMGAVSAAVLGAPISTTLIVFELTGDWQLGLAVMVAVSLSSAVASQLVHRSFFLTQLERRGIHLAAGPQAYLLSMFRVASVMRTPDHPRAAARDDCLAMIEDGLYLSPKATLEDAMPIFEETNSVFLPVLNLPKAGEPPEILGALFQVDALKQYSRALAATAAEEHS
ncbi:MAG: chloride channel protein [Pseudomonadota bacterium]